MKRSIRFLALSCLLMFGLAACAGTPPEAAPVNVQLQTIPNPPVVGNVELIFSVTDANGEPIEGATVDVAADHTDMTGMGMSGLAVDNGGGKYVVRADFSMSGTWLFKVYVRGEGFDFSRELKVIVE